MARSWKRIVADYKRAFPHVVELSNTGGWRTDHTGHALRHLSNERYRWWTVAGVSVWGFKDAADAAAFKGWAERSAIDWSVPPAEQPPETRPPKPPEGPVHGAPAVYRIIDPPKQG